MRIRKVGALLGAFGSLALSGCGRNVDAREWHPMLFPFYAANCYGKSIEEKARKGCNLTKEERDALSQAGQEENRRQQAALAQQHSQMDARFAEEKSKVVAGLIRWMDQLLQQFEADPRIRLDRSGPSAVHNLSQRAITDEYEKCAARVALGKNRGGAPCEEVMRWRIEASTSWIQRNLAR